MLTGTSGSGMRSGRGAICIETVRSGDTRHRGVNAGGAGRGSLEPHGPTRRNRLWKDRAWIRANRSRVLTRRQALSQALSVHDLV